MPEEKDKTIPELEKDLLTGAAEDGDDKGASPAQQAVEGGEDARLSPDDESGEAADDPNDDAETREKRRLERQQRKNRQRMAKARSQQEINELRAQNAQMAARLEALERGNVGSTKQQYIQQAHRANEAFIAAEAAIAKAMETNDPQAMTKALRVRDEARAVYDQAASVVRRIEEAEKAPPRRAAPEPTQGDAPDPQMIAEYRKFQARNPWYDPNGRDPDSQKAVVIDSALHAEGYDPSTEDYWNELESRLRRAVPHQYDADDAPPPRPASRRSGPPVNGTRDSAGATGTRDTGLSAARLAAIREAAGDDAKKFARLVSYAKNYDKTKRATTASR